MVKESCSCKHNNYLMNGSSFYLFNKYNKIIKENKNPHLDILQRSNEEHINTNRINNNSCNTPWRMPYNHYRKTHSCTNNPALPPADSQSNCISNETIITDTNECIIECNNKISTRLVNKFGLRISNDGGNYENYLYKRGKLFSQNIAGLLQENRDINGSVHDPQGKYLYKINNVNSTVYNKNSGTKSTSNCGLERAKTKEIIISYTKIPTAVKKFSNPKYGKSSSVSSRNRLQRLKYNTKLASQFGNCINGEICSKYGFSQKNTIKPAKLFQFSTGGLKRCIPSKIHGSKLSCPK